MPWTAKFHVDHDERIVTIKYESNADGNYETLAIEEQLIKARELGTFKILHGWRNEVYPLYGIDRDVRIERSGSALFGILTVGVHMTGYQRTQDGQMKIWVPRRAPTKSTYAGMLDNTVAGGIAAGEDQFECIVREAAEEASLPDALVREKAVAVGTISYFHIRDSRAGGEAGLFQPETQYLYDIELDASTIPKPSDDEVQEFYLWTVEEVEAGIKAGEFKPNCAICLIDFLIRHGKVTAENEPDYREIVARIHRRMRF
jgi:8-oxo-dGTP pyrophosphatase MutT (NUDIX family)